MDDKTVMGTREWLVWQIVNRAEEGRPLQEADLSISYLNKAAFQKANLQGANLETAQIDERQICLQPSMVKQLGGLKIQIRLHELPIENYGRGVEKNDVNSWIVYPLSASGVYIKQFGLERQYLLCILVAKIGYGRAKIR